MLSVQLAGRVLEYVDPVWLPSAAVREVFAGDGNNSFETWVRALPLNTFCCQCYTAVEGGTGIELSCGHGAHVPCVSVADYQAGVTSCARCQSRRDLPAFQTVCFPVDLFRVENIMLDVMCVWRGVTDQDRLVRGHGTWFVPFTPPSPSLMLGTGIHWGRAIEVGYFQTGFVFASCSTVCSGVRRNHTSLKWVTVNVVKNGVERVSPHIPQCDIRAHVDTTEHWGGWVRVAARYQIRHWGPFSLLVFYNADGVQCTSFICLCIQSGNLCFVESVKHKRGRSFQGEEDVDIMELQMKRALE